jgi:hypothetical protein
MKKTETTDDTPKKKSAFVSFNTRTLRDLPGFPDDFVIIRKLRDERVEEARTAVLTKQVKTLQELGGMEVAQLIDTFTNKAVKLDPETVAKAEASRSAAQAKVAADPYLAFDRDTLCKRGIVNWSFTDDEGKPISVSDETVLDLESELKEHIARAVFALSVPTADNVKNASAPSSST